MILTAYQIHEKLSASLLQQSHPHEPSHLTLASDQNTHAQVDAITTRHVDEVSGRPWIASSTRSCHHVIGCLVDKCTHPTWIRRISLSECQPVWSNAALGSLFLPLIALCGRRYSHRHVLSSCVWPPSAARLQTLSCKK